VFFGALVLVVMGGGISFDGGSEEKAEVVVDSRRRNSLAFNITRFVGYQDEDLSQLVDVYKKELAEEALLKKKPKVTKTSRMADGVLRGNFRELKNQVVNFKTINRKFADQHNNNNLIHFICQEGYDRMLEFMLDPRNHAESDHVELEINPRNNKDRIPLFLCFTPPFATFCGQNFGITPDGEPLSERPDGVETLADWIKPGAHANREKVISMMLSKGADVNAKDYHNFTCLLYASMWGWTSTVKLLLEAGANINATTITGRNALMFAIEFLHDDLIEFLAAEPHMEINAVDADGITALLLAMEHNEEGLAAVECLCRAGADVNLMNHRKKTPLHLACANQNLPQVNLLLDFKCQRRNSALDLLQGEAKTSIENRILAEERAVKEEAARLEKERKLLALEGQIDTSAFGYKNKSPYGQWVEYIDKRDQTSFYYNKVSRLSQKDKPKDFKPDKKRVVKETTFGHAFYH